MRDTRDDSSFRPTLGNNLTAWFCVGDLAKAETIVAVESPIDALSYHSLFLSNSDPTAVVSCSGSNVSSDMMFEAYERRQRFVVALDNDDAGERGWQRAWDETADWTGFDLSSDCPRRRDWNDDLKAPVRQTTIAQRAVYAEVHRTFRPELIGRVDEKIVFKPLSQQIQREIGQLEVAEELARFRQQGVNVTVSGPALEFLMRRGIQKTLGARPMKRTVQKYIGDAIRVTLKRGLSPAAVIEVHPNDARLADAPPSRTHPEHNH